MSGFSWFKVAVFGLLACNAIIFARAGTAMEALDSIAWFVLLALFELETGFGAINRRPDAAIAVRATRLVAAVAVGVAAVGYVHDGAWLDAVNAWLWIGVVALLELEVRHPRAVAARRGAFTATAAVLYGGLAAVVLTWAWQREWFDAYDALLWLVAFATIEINVLGYARGAGIVARSRKSPAELGDKV